MEEAATEFGIVQVVAGPHKGVVGFYDNDAASGKAIVYPGYPAFTDLSYNVEKRSLCNPTPEQQIAYQKTYRKLYAEFEEECRREAEAHRQEDDAIKSQHLLEAIQALPEDVRRKLLSESTDPEREAINSRRHAAHQRIHAESFADK